MAAIHSIDKKQLHPDDEKKFREVDLKNLTNREGAISRWSHRSYKRFLTLSSKNLRVSMAPVRIDLAATEEIGKRMGDEDECNRVEITNGPGSHTELESDYPTMVKVLRKRGLFCIGSGDGFETFMPIRVWWDGRHHHVVMRSTMEGPRIYQDKRLVDLVDCKPCVGRADIDDQDFMKADEIIASSFDGEVDLPPRQEVSEVVMNCTRGCVNRVIRDLCRNGIRAQCERSGAVYRVRFQTKSYCGLLKWIISNGTDVSVVGPAQIQTGIQAEIGKIVEMYRHLQ